MNGMAKVLAVGGGSVALGLAVLILTGPVSIPMILLGWFKEIFVWLGITAALGFLLQLFRKCKS